MRTLLTRVTAAVMLVAALAGCAGTAGTYESAIQWMERQPSTDDK